MKAVLVIDKPNRCIDCGFSEYRGEKWFCIAKYRFENGVNWEIENINEKASWCPLRPLPQPLDLTKYPNGSITKDIAEGYNMCLKEITGEKE